MNFHRLKVFYLVARLESFSRAAEELYTSQPNVSKHVHQLEAELGVSLFHRLGGSIELTEAGRAVYRYAQQVFDQTVELQRTLAELEGLTRGYLRLGASSTPGLYLLPEMIAAFGHHYPGLEMSFSIGNSQQVVDEVLAGKLDLGFVEGFIEAAGLQRQAFGANEVVLIAPAGHRLAGQADIAATDLGGETFIVRESGSGTRQAMEAILASLGFSPQRTLELPSCEAAKRAVAAGLGLSFVSRYALDLELDQGLLTVLSGAGFSLAYPLYVISRKDVRLSQAALAFLAFTRKQGAFEQG
ncbi:MAG: LysR family transcriptional regulator [Chloroflexota bacterium]|nr:MAG: LysR family transcriptional regulator [Chloroflexota bacterium]